MKTRLHRIPAFFAIAALLLPAPLVTSQEIDLDASVKQYEVVPCLLPARIRKLGRMSYPERRQLTETSALECELKGGEYTFYDRAQPESAVAFFRKLADDGNVDAQVSLGDAYQYLFSEPDYEQAVSWYQRAIENGSNKGMMQLARLYERGLGVPKDPLKATNLWREATGAGEELVLASELDRARTEADERISELTEALRDRSEEAELIRNELQLASREIDERKNALVAAETELQASRQEFERLAQNNAPAPENTALRDQLTQQQRLIDEQRYQLESMEAGLGVQEARLTASLRQAELQNERLNQELNRVTSRADEELQVALMQLDEKDAQLSNLQQELASAEAELGQTSAEYQQVVAELDDVRARATRNEAGGSDQIARLEAERVEQQNRMTAQNNRLAQLKSALETALADSQRLRSDLDEQVHITAEVEAQFASTEAQLQRTREDMRKVTVDLAAANNKLSSLNEERAALEQRLAATSNSRDQNFEQIQQLLATQNQQISTQQSRISELEGTVDIYRSELTEISLRRASFAQRTAMEDTTHIRLPRDVKLGRYYALVIGNSSYEYLNDLENATNDANAVHRVLQDEYAFDSTLLIDATQKQIYQAFVDLQKKTSPEDLVLIYYAGHGYEIKSESYWLPVEVQSRQEAEVSGISSLKVADWARAMPARHVMIIADSCYSGSGIEATGGFRYSVQDLQEMLPYFLKSKSRTMLTSGGVAPVMDGDGAGGEFSIFTKELVGLLLENRGVLYGEALYDYMLERVKYTPDGMTVNQTPLFGSIESAGHESGQFVLIHRSMRG